MNQRQFKQALRKLGYTVKVLDLNTGKVLRGEKKPARWFEFPVDAPLDRCLSFIKDVELMMNKYPGIQFTVPKALWKS